jgi:predicted pyridoxine 5'-phosphate oxidase superfamily flavin-nucleotide-binding protein
MLQCAYGTRERAEKFYKDQVLDHLNAQMIDFVRRLEMAFIATADAAGHADCSLRAGAPGFIQVLDSRRIAYPEYRGNGVMASLGNISENPHIGLLLVDFTHDVIGLHVNARATIVDDLELDVLFERGRTPERWVVAEVEEAYIHCRKHIPRLVPVGRDRQWGTDDVRSKGGDYFGARAQARDVSRS